MAETTVIIPNFNGREHLDICLTSLSLQTYRNYAVVMVDNGSTDGSAEFVREKFPTVTVVPLEKNFGFAKAVNEGIARTSTDVVVLLNNDVEVDSRWLEFMVASLKRHPEVGAVACKMLNFFARDTIDAAGDVVSKGASAEARGHGAKDGAAFDVEQYIFGACAGAAAYRRAVFRDAGLFDESFVSYYEDIDLDFRIQSCGWKVLYVPNAVCYHKRGATKTKMAADAVRLHVRNDLFWLLKNVPIQIIFRRLPLILRARAGSWLSYMRDGYSRQVIRGLMEVAKAAGVLISQRRMLKLRRRVPVSYLESMMT